MCFAWYFAVSLFIYPSRDEPQGHHHPHQDREHCDQYPSPAHSRTCMTASLSSTSGHGTEGWFPSGCPVLITLRSTYVALSYHQVHITEMGAIWGSKRLTPENYACLHELAQWGRVWIQSQVSLTPFHCTTLPSAGIFWFDASGSRKQARKRFLPFTVHPCPQGSSDLQGEPTLTQGSGFPSLAHSAV